MKIFISDGQVAFYKYKITGVDKLGRTVTRYAKDLTQKSEIETKLTSPVSTDITPLDSQVKRATEWQSESRGKSFNLEDAQNFINTNVDEIISSKQVKIHSSNSAKKFIFDYNESEDSLDIFYNKDV